MDAAPSRDHVQALRQAGLSLARIAELSGAGRGTVNALADGTPARRQPPPTRVRADTERRLLAVRADPSNAAPGRRIDATGTRRRLHGLAALGWSIPALTPHTTLTARTLRRTLTAGTVTAGTARAIAALYHQLHAIAVARPSAAGRAAPPAWDHTDNDTDQPDTPPRRGLRGDHLDANETDTDTDPGHDDRGPVLDQVAVERAMTGERLHLTNAERRDAVARLTRCGLSARLIAELLHTTSGTVTRLRAAGRDVAA